VVASGAAAVSTDTPTLTAHLPSPASPDGDTCGYWFKVTSGADGNSGSIVVASGWLTGTPGADLSWSVPPGYLQNGSTYYWNVTVGDGSVNNIPTTTSSFDVDLRLGNDGPSPFDRMGPLTVNLATGHANYTAKTQSMASVGGTLGMIYSYNSDAPSNTGLLGEYFSNTTLAGPPKAMQRDKTMQFDWNGQPPVAGLLGINWSARWTGYLTLPTPASGPNSTWYPMVASHGGVKLWINNVLVVNTWAVPSYQNYPTFHAGSDFTQAANTPVAIRLELFDDTAPGALDVRILPKPPASDPTFNQPLQGNWLSVASPALPYGWEASADLDGSLSYTRLSNWANVVSLMSSDGAIKRYKWNGSAYVPDPGADGILTFTCGGGTCWWDYVGGGMSERFNPDGSLKWARSNSDDLHPAAAELTWTTPATNAPARLTTIGDPVSGRHVNVRYSGDAACPAVPSGFDSAPPPGMICEINFTEWGAFGGNTDFFYATGRLAMVRGIGGSTDGYDTTTFAYDALGRLTRIREPLANDAFGSFTTDQPDTVVAYGSDGRVASVLAPEPLPTSTPNPSSRQKHTYAYVDIYRATQITGRLPSGDTPIRTVTWDADARQTSDIDAAGHTASQEWDPAADAVSSTTNAAGLRTTTVRDQQHRPTDTYGPAPASWFNGLLPASGHGDVDAAPMPHGSQQFDGGLDGLAAAWWNSFDLSGDPVAHSLWRGTAGLANASWGTGSPDPNVHNDNFSGQLTGEIKLPAAGSGANRWQFKVVADDGSQVFVDDNLIVNSWGTLVPGGVAGTLPFDVTANSWHRFRVMYQEATGSTTLNLSYRQGTGAWITIPTVNLTPRYDLVTHTRNPDGKILDTSYSDSNGIGVQYGLPTFTTADAGGLNLVSHDSYETPGPATYLRHVGHQLPNNIATGASSSDAYYGDTETRTFPSVSGCPTGTSVNQGGLVKLHTGVDPDPSSTGVGKDPSTLETIYNNQGAPAFTREAAGAWACTGYDSRLRVKVAISSDGKVTQYNYSTPRVLVSTYVDSGGTSRSTSTTVDLLGKTLSYTDEQGTTTRTAYDVAGRIVDVYRTLPGGSELHFSSATYDNDGRILTSTEYVSTPSGRTTSTGYDSFGRPDTLDRPTSTYPVRTATTYDTNSGNSTVQTTSRNGVTQWTDGYAYSLEGKVTVDWSSAVLRQYGYDGADRLVTSTENGVLVRQYAFDGDSNRCDLGTVSVGCSSSSYTYNPADQLTASPLGSSYSYDARGRLDTYTKAGGGTVNIDYDTNNHATRIDDGVNRVDETLDPSGRVLRRVVTSPPGSTIVEDTSFGYSGADDSPTWSRPTGGGTYTTYIGTEVVVGTTPTYGIANAHGDIVGTTDQSGTFTANPVTDEYGVSLTVPSNRLGWLGASQRLTDHVGLGIIRMGVRLYLPGLGRFLQSDPVLGGSCNDYDCVCGDPVNSFDINGKYADGGSPAHWKWVQVQTAAAKAVKAATPTARKGSSVKKPSPPPKPKPENRGAANINIGYCWIICGQVTVSFKHDGILPDVGASVGGLGFKGTTFTVTHSNLEYCQRNKAQVTATAGYLIAATGSVGQGKDGEPEWEDWESGVGLGYGAQAGPMTTFLSTC
jgi:RHS repeat-associated protein